jgi:signal peptidase II
MLALCLSFAIVALDQAVKYAVRSRLALGEFIPVIPGCFDLRYIQNTGAAWGILEGLNQWLVVLSLVMLVAIVGFRRHFLPNVLLSKIATGLIIGGIAGNLMDRVRLNYVVDFLDFYWRAHHFPAFNVADASICIGAATLAVALWMGERRPRPDPRLEADVSQSPPAV